MGLCTKKRKIRRTRWEDEWKNRVTTRTSWQQWGSELSFYSYPLTLFILVFLFILKYRPIFIFQLESDIFPVMAGTIQYVAFFFNFFPFHDRLNWPTVCPIFPVEPWFVRFSQNSCIPGFLCLKNRILVRFPVFPVGPSGPV